MKLMPPNGAHCWSSMLKRCYVSAKFPGGEIHLMFKVGMPRSVDTPCRCRISEVYFRRCKANPCPVAKRDMIISWVFMNRTHRQLKLGSLYWVRLKRQVLPFSMLEAPCPVMSRGRSLSPCPLWPGWNSFRGGRAQSWSWTGWQGPQSLAEVSRSMVARSDVPWQQGLGGVRRKKLSDVFTLIQNMTKWEGYFLRFSFLLVFF